MPAPPPATPSPHRFLTGQRKPGTATRDSKPASALRQQVLDSASAERTPQTQPERVKISSQFAPTPRFSTGRPAWGAPTQRSPSPQKPLLVDALRPSATRADDVEDAASSNEDDEMLDDEQSNALATTEMEIVDQQWTHNVTFSPKRCRLDNLAEPAVGFGTPFKRPQHAASHLRDSIPQFALPHSSSTQATTTNDTPSHQRPAFIRPSVAPQEPSEPLPETFSPRKRGQKFVPGGMAATVQQWVIETGQAAVQSRRGQGYLRGEDYVTRIKLDRVVGNGPFTTHGKTASMEAVDLLLAGKANADGEAKGVAAGDVVGIRAPTWDLELEGTTWTVAVDWKTL